MKSTVDFVSSFTFEVERGRTEEDAWNEMDVEMVLRRSKARLEFARKGIAQLQQGPSKVTAAAATAAAAANQADPFTMHELHELPGRDERPPKWKYPQASSARARLALANGVAEEKDEVSVRRRQERTYMWQWSPSGTLRSESEKKKRRRKKKALMAGLLTPAASALAPENQRELSEAGQIAILCNFVAMIRSGKRKLFGVPVSTLQATFHAIDMHRYNLTLSDRGE